VAAYTHELVVKDMVGENTDGPREHFRIVKLSCMYIYTVHQHGYMLV